MECKRTDCISKPLSHFFEKLGSLVGSYPVYFFVIPLIISAALGGGFTFLSDREDNDLERQFTPKKGPSKVARAFVRENFPYNHSMFSKVRLYDKGDFASLIAVSANGSSVLENPSIEDIIRLNDKILNITVDHTTGRLGFKELCARANGECVTNVILDILQSNDTDHTGVTFPVYSYGSSSVFLGSVIGGVTTNSNDSVLSAQAMTLFYFLNREENMAEARKLWLRGFKQVLSAGMEREHTQVSYYTSKSRQEEIDSHTTDGFPLFLITYVSAITFSVISCLRLDNVRNKVWVAICSVVSIGLAILSAFGLLLYIGVPFVITVANAPFLILGIGLNNMFVMVSDWQHTKVKEPVPERLAHTFKEAVMSITITALTDVLKFSIGVTSDFPSVQSFCLYTTASVVFCYIYTITFFGAFLALNGRREASNRHWLTCMKVPADNEEINSEIYNICCVGGNYDKESGAEKTQPISNFFRRHYGPFLIKPHVKGLVVLVYTAYLAVSIYGCFHIQQGIELYDLAADNSHVITYTRKDRQYFSTYGPTVMVVVSEEFPYWDGAKRSQLQSCVDDFKGLPFVYEDIYASWLDSYLAYGQDAHLNLDDRDVFIQNLHPFFDLFPFFKQDVNVSGTGIHASRVFIQTIDMANSSMEIQMMDGLKATVDRCSAASLLVYNEEFIYFDQYGVVVSSTIKNVGVITAVMLVVSFLLIPDLLCSLCVTCSIGSVTVGVTGLMALWDITLDSISMIVFTVCIGFTVDFSAHVTYAFVSSKKRRANDKAVDALFSLGQPILLGAVSTMLGVSVLSTSEFHTFRTFFQIFFLVMFIGMLHGLVFIPVLLTLLKCNAHKEKSSISTIIKR